MAFAPVTLISLLFHGLIAWRLLPDLPSGAAPLLGGVLLVSALLVPRGLMGRGAKRGPWSTAMVWIGLLCMGLFSSLLVLTLLRDVLLLGAWATQAVGWKLDMAVLRHTSAEAVPLLALLMTVLGFWNARRTAAVVRVDVPIANLPQALHGFTMVQISDIHVGPTIKTHYLQRIVDRVNSLGAHMVAITGDLVDGSVKELGQHIAPLAKLQSTHGTFFVTGNHEYYSGAHSWIDALRALGVQVLMNEHVVIHHGNDTQDPERAMVVVAGVADYSAHHFDESHRSDPHAAMAQAPEQALFKLLLAHQPRSAAVAEQAGFDLQLSGHTHGGQFWPWGYFVRFQQPFTAGLHKLGGLWVYTSRGTGYWGPPKRFGAPSEITLLRLMPA
ncbi:metallophosphoesterase [Rhodoferax saidenbachensis]|uniref:MPP superfamily phosphohydrolase n=1 Tax=Rhodoferax saidenbachensis TaxID=1484693 RepID=A0ABU1ZPS7_9BURK|nr:metallophosphoesterase [Rhodoferax saidenbachensis]MDR7307562.1 putative MPP superfamily phosphohydrolase [Rhodoferax saidenbachensis]